MGISGDKRSGSDCYRHALPLRKEKRKEEAGFILLEKMKQREHPIPVIICSSQNYLLAECTGDGMVSISSEILSLILKKFWKIPTGINFRDESRKRREGETHDLCDV